MWRALTQLREVKAMRGPAQRPTATKPARGPHAVHAVQESRSQKRTRTRMLERAAREDSGAGSARASLAPAASATAELGGPALSPLHWELVDFAWRCAPTAVDFARLERTVSAVARAGEQSCGTVRLEVVGSQAAALALPGGDLDLRIATVRASLRVQAPLVAL